MAQGVGGPQLQAALPRWSITPVRRTAWKCPAVQHGWTLVSERDPTDVALIVLSFCACSQVKAVGHYHWRA